MNHLESVALAAAELLSGRDWHALNQDEMHLLEHLEKAGYITKNEPANGFVGKVNHTMASVSA